MFGMTLGVLWHELVVCLAFRWHHAGTIWVPWTRLDHGSHAITGPLASVGSVWARHMGALGPKPIDSAFALWVRHMGTFGPAPIRWASGPTWANDGMQFPYTAGSDDTVDGSFDFYVHLFRASVGGPCEHFRIKVEHGQSRSGVQPATWSRRMSQPRPRPRPRRQQQPRSQHQSVQPMRHQRRHQRRIQCRQHPR